tara:strand:+ start:1685 stop:1807 length:123 start_codon:yes stop_codon:yes gene_type:complete
MEFLLDAYLPEHYKNSTGSMRRYVMVRFGELIDLNKPWRK